MTVKIACVACLDPALSVHTPTFLYATELTQDLLLGDRGQILYFDDRADPDQAARVAQDIANAAPEVVVGHFASACAAAAIRHYRRAGIPLILPAATKTELTEGGGVYRICDNDADYCAWLSQCLPEPIGRIETDGSAHGLSIRSQLIRLVDSEQTQNSETVLFSGMYQSSVQFVARTSAPTIILTDDADAPSLADDLISMGVDLERKRVLVATMRPQVKSADAAKIVNALYRRHGRTPGTYFWETVAALQVAVEIKHKNRLQTGIPSVLGPIRFDERGESRPRQFALYDVFSEAA